MAICILGARFSAGDALDPAVHRRLHASDWRLRKVAFFQVKDDKSLKTRIELMDLLDHELSAINEAYRSGIGAESKYGEAYVAYTDEVTKVVADNFKQFHDESALKTLLHSGYNPDSIFARWLGEQGAKILPYTQEMLRSDMYPDREDSVAVIAHLISASRSSKVLLTSAERKEAFDQLHDAATNPDMFTRLVAVQYLGRVGSSDDIELLKHISENDPGFDKLRAKYPVREAALQALAAIEKQ